uniref:Uncharacterized protein n=1 Tax=Oryza nivara TaxID=4536 RepID=A0A0E0IC65_ORYNI
MGQPETVYTGPQRLECGPRKGWPHWLAARKPGRGEHRVPPPTAAAAMAAAAAATARSSVAPHASPTLRRSGSSGSGEAMSRGSLHFLRVLLKILPSLSTLTGIADSVYLLRLQKQARAAAGCIPSTHFSVAMLAC